VKRFVARRLAALVPQLLAASLLIFLLLRLLPGDLALTMLADTPHTLEMREALREELGLNDPLPVQYARWLWETTTGLRGVARSTGEPLRELVVRQLPVTLLLSLYSIVLGTLVSVPLGILAAGARRSVDRAIDGLAVLGLAVPSLWLALLVLLALLNWFRWSPPIIYFGPLEVPGEHFALMIWPALLLAWEHVAHILPVVRAETRSALHEPFVHAARARGLSIQETLWRHAGRHAIRPAVTAVSIQFGASLGGALVLETIFGIPGIGRGLVGAAVARDFPAVQTIVFVLVALFLVVMLVADVVAVLVEPRLREALS
jgi:peptide/nickel transport system permease protein